MTQAKFSLDDFLTLPTGNVCDAANKSGLPIRVMDAGIRPIDQNSRIAGYAFTVRCPGGGNLAIHHAIARAPAGSVLVIDVQGYMKCGHIGGIISAACQERGIKGIIIDGTCRDWDEILELKFPVFSRGANPNSNLKEKAGAINIPVSCGGVMVMPGDVIVADITGVTVFTKEDAPPILEKAKAIFDKELKIVEEVRKGKNTIEIYGFPPIE